MDQRRDSSYRGSRCLSFLRRLWYSITSIFQHFVCCPAPDTPRPQLEVVKPEGRLLVIGASDTGKSTFMRQMRLEFGDQYPVPERRNHQPHIRRNLLESIHKLITEVINCNLSYATPEAEEAASRFLDWASVEALLEKSDYDDPSLSESIATLWLDPAIQEVYRQRSRFHLMTNADYFISSAARVLEDDYLPTVDDILRMRFVTRGSVTKTYELSNIMMTLHDMGGQRPERQQWVSQLCNPSAILFVASLSEYDQTVEETAEEKNRVQESLDIFDELLEYSPFEHTPVILLLNKSDIFSIKIQEHHLRTFFPGYKGPDGDEIQGRDYITSLYEEIASKYRRNLLVRYTEATNRENFRAIFAFVSNYVSRMVVGIGGLF